MAKIAGGEMLVRALVSQGVREVFALSGGHLDPMFQGCLDHGVRLIDTRHEAAATHMADGFARTSGRPGVAFVTAGPGVTNALTGVANAYMDAVPMICIGGRSPLRDEDKMPLQNVDQVGIMAPVTKWARTVLHPERIPEYVAAAWRHAVSGRPGPAFLDIPVDILYTPVDEADVPAFQQFAPEGKPVADVASVDRALAALANAERPAIFAGGGVMFSGAAAELREFAELANIPVFANSKARGAVPESGALGFNGYGLTVWPTARTAGGGAPDVIVMLGARVGMFTGSSGVRQTLIPDEATLIQIDIEAEEIGRTRDVQIGLVGDVRETLRLFLDRAKGRTFRDHSRWVEAIQQSAQQSRTMHDAEASRPGAPIHQAKMAKEIAEFLGSKSIIVADGGETSQWMSGQSVVDEPGHYLSHGYLGCLGVGIPFGLAAKVAHPGTRVLTIIGDGSAGLNIAEFDTAVRHEIPLVTVVNNDQGWGMIRHLQAAQFGAERVIGAELGPVRYDLVAAGFGAHHELVTEPEEIRPALDRAFASGRAACLNIMTDPTQPFAPPGSPRPAARKEPKPEEKEIELPYYGKRKLGSD